MKQQIVKIQLPMMASDDDLMSECLVYNEDQSIMQQLPCPKGLPEMMMEGRGAEYNGMKNYFYIHLDSKKQIIIDGLAPWQDW